MGVVRPRVDRPPLARVGPGPALAPAADRGVGPPGLRAPARLTRRWRNGSREPATCFYDVTKQAYYGSECPWAEVGHDPTIGAIGTVVGFGLVVSLGHHQPSLCRTLSGSLADPVSLDTTLRMLEGFGLGRITRVVDRGIVSRENIGKVVGAGHHLLGMIRGWNEKTRALATRWSETELERTEFVVARSHGNAAYARGFVGPLFGQPKVRIVVVSDARRRVEERQSRDLLIQELEGPLPRGRLEEIRRELGSAVVPSVGRRGSGWTRRRSNGSGSSMGGSCSSTPIRRRRRRRCFEPTSRRMWWRR